MVTDDERMDTNCIMCGDDDWWKLKPVIVLPEGFKNGDFDWSIWEDKIGVKVPVCPSCIGKVELNNEGKIFCSNMNIKLGHQEATVFCNKCSDYIMMPLACSSCLRAIFKKLSVVAI